MHTARIVAKPPLVGGVDQLRDRPIDEPTGAKPRQHQCQRRAQRNQKNPTLGTTLDFPERLRLVETEGHEKLS